MAVCWISTGMQAQMAQIEMKDGSQRMAGRERAARGLGNGTGATRDSVLGQCVGMQTPHRTYARDGAEREKEERN